MDIAALAAEVRAAATRANHRRLVVLAGDRDACIDAAFDVLDGADVPDDETTIVTAREGFRFERLHPKRAGELLGSTRTAVVCDAHEEFSPNVVGRLVGAVDGGGLFVLLTPPLDEWPARTGSFDESLAVPPFSVSDVTGRFRERLVSTLRDHPGVAIANVDEGVVERDGSAPSPPDVGDRSPSVPRERERRFPRLAYESCLTGDQSRTLRSLERLADPGEAVVVEADRGRGKSAAAGLAAASLAAEGRDVLVTAPSYRSAEEVFVRAETLLSDLGALADSAERTSAGRQTQSGDHDEERHVLRANAEAGAEGGRVRFSDPPTAATLPDDPDAVLVDEAAALPVRLLSSFLDAPAAGFFTTVHGYEGAGRGFSVRFRDRLAESDFTVTDAALDEPIRYARGDPVETWAFRALLLDARPPVDPLVEDATPETVEYRAVSPEELLADDHLLSEAFGLLVFAHYRTEPNDLARLLDAPNLELRALCHEGHVVSVALLAREGGLDAETRRAMYEGARVRGNMLPDVFTSQLRDEEAGVPVGYRVMRIATHHAVRSRGLGSRLLTAVRREFAGRADYLGVGYGATPELLSFWAANGYSTVHLSTTRNDTSGEYSALMLLPLSEAGEALRDRHASYFIDRIVAVLSDPLRDVEPDVARAALRACEADVSPSLSDREWRVVVGASYGPGIYSAAPEAFRRLALAHLLSPDRVELDAREERLLVRKVLQGRPWTPVSEELGYVSQGQCMRALGDAYKPLVDEYGPESAREERARFTD
ncbi:tRNA(Met) cytidine acetyltransferase TmcA [Halopelagius longus]|uniref:tRNA(Met) cytidine acetyltransferase TmcA n=1 Tax=Halopelagius longus TaxID=1236180 RepID=A0A1H0Z3B2_9EURY|nr:tRNA(Met) cytidine acetyltransferase TmcA [Halopelagius longus]RDI72798.1 tRNA(Met) cytidine acetyltransferase [Halopelagius longus]SDQ21641.1 tRNA(Met) cytidine acetyltransferase [Halopelagius longus]